MVSRGDVDADRLESLELRLEEIRSVRLEAVVLVEVAAAKQGVHFQFYGLVDNAMQRDPEGLAPGPRGVLIAFHPSECAVQVEVGKEKEPCHRGITDFLVLAEGAILIRAPNLVSSG